MDNLVNNNRERISIKELEPGSYDILISMERYLAKSDISRHLRELIKIRASQINKCAYCLEMHIDDAIAAGESEQRLHAVAAWQESPYFTDQERAVLQLTEEITHISRHGVNDNTFSEMKRYFTDNQIAQIILIINQINFWNRIAVSTKLIYTKP